MNKKRELDIRTSEEKKEEAIQKRCGHPRDYRCCCAGLKSDDKTFRELNFEH